MILALLDHLWQSSLYAACIWLLALNLSRNKASLRYWLWLTASAKFLVPFALIAVAGALMGENRTLIAAGAEFAHLQPMAQPFSNITAAVSAPTATVHYFEPVLAALWLAGFGAMVARYISQWARVREAVQNSTRTSTAELLEIRFSRNALEPGLIGIFRPVISLPDDLAEHLTDEEIKTVIDHELCHWHRRDNLTALLHMLVEALFWFFPPLKWIGARLNEERERSCDEYVLATGVAPRVYTEAILKVCKLYAPSPLSCVPGVASANLKKRLDIILVAQSPATLTPLQKVLLTGFALMLLAIPFTAGLQMKRSWQSAPTLDEIAGAQAAQAAPRKQVPFNPANFDAFAGYYLSADMLDRFAILSRRGDHFYFQWNGRPVVEIYPESGSKFFTRSVPGGRQIQFNTDTFGRTSSLTLYQNGPALPPFPKISAAKAAELDRAFESRIRNNVPIPNSQAVLQRFIEDARIGEFSDIKMPMWLLALYRQDQPALRALLIELGAVKDVKFIG